MYDSQYSVVRRILLVCINFPDDNILLCVRDNSIFFQISNQIVR